MGNAKLAGIFIDRCDVGNLWRAWSRMGRQPERG